jgi:hypothetical protein
MNITETDFNGMGEVQKFEGQFTAFRTCLLHAERRDTDLQPVFRTRDRENDDRDFDTQAEIKRADCGQQVGKTLQSERGGRELL